MTLLDFIAILLCGGIAAIASGGACGIAVGYKKIDMALAGLMGMFYGALAGSGVIVTLIVFLILR